MGFKLRCSSPLVVLLLPYDILFLAGCLGRDCLGSLKGGRGVRGGGEIFFSLGFSRLLLSGSWFLSGVLLAKAFGPLELALKSKFFSLGGRGGGCMHGAWLDVIAVIFFCFLRLVEVGE
ncbi:Uncharacterized protein TCM_042890 [Theobroma cacao]|uniref:Uncharacterized protein n=1 Tax=Theobroma cacao TaxID=3641 RepID=A0A061FLW4_THECC|nr:Uncharacterized protein TCM_042890 [Theobroma cacao]